MGRHSHESRSPASSRARRRMPPPPSSPEQHTPRRPTPEDHTSYSHEEDRHQRSLSSRSEKKRKEKKKEKKKEKNYFHLMLQDGESSGSRPLTEIRRSELLKKVPVPGQKKLCDGSVAIAAEATPKLRHILIASKNLIFCLKGQRRSLNGKFGIKNLVWIPATKQIKFRKIKEEEFMDYEEERGKEDCRSIAESVEKLLHGYQLPDDIKHWLALLKSDPYNQTYLIKNHMCLLAPIAKLQQFIYLYGELEQIKLKLKTLQNLKRNLGSRCGYLRGERDHFKHEIDRGFTFYENRYQQFSVAYDAAEKEEKAVMDEMKACSAKKNAILKAVRCGDTETGTNWRERPKDNEHLNDVFGHFRDSCDNLTGAAGLLDFVRNCSQHLMVRSVTEQGGVKFSYLQIVTIICHSFPKLFHEFQEAMCNQGIEDPSCKKLCASSLGL